MQARRGAAGPTGRPRPFRGRWAEPVPAGEAAARAATWAVVLVPVSLLAVLPGGYSRFVLVKAVVLAVAVLAAALARPAGRLPRGVVAVVAAGAGVLALAAVLGPAPAAQLAGRYPRYEGVVVLGLYAGLLWAGARVLGPGAAPGTRRRFARACAGSAGVLAAVAVVDLLGVELLGVAVDRTVGLMGNATELGAAGAVLLLLLAPRALRAREPWAVAGVVGAAACVVVSGSRAAVLGSLVGAAVVVLVEARRGRDGRAGRTGAAGGGAASWSSVRAGPAWAGAAAVVGAAAASALLLPDVRGRLLGTSPLAWSTVDGRLLMWRESLDLVRARPWTGVGPSGFVDAFPAYLGTAWSVRVGRDDPPDSPHLVLLQAATAGGLPLLFLLLALATVALLGARRGLRSRPDDELLPGLLAAAAGYGVVLLTHPTGPGTTGPACFVLGALVAVTRPARDRQSGAALLVPRSVAAAALAAVLVLGAASAGEYRLAAGTAAVVDGDLTAADRAFTGAWRLRPWDPDVPLLAATAFGGRLAAGDTGAAGATETWARRSLRRVPTGVEARPLLASALEARGDLDGAARVWDEVVLRDPSDAEAYLGRGVVAAEQGRYAQAEQDFRAAARLAPDSDAPRENLELLEQVRGG